MAKLHVLVLALAIAAGTGFAGQGPAHSGRCRGVVRPPMLRIIGGPWTCTRDGWRWPPFGVTRFSGIVR